MADHIDLRLISMIVKEGNFRDVLKSKFTKDLLSQPEARSMFDDVWNHFHSKKHPGKVPSRRRMQSRHPSFRTFHHSGDTIIELCEEIRAAAVARRLVDITRDTPDAIVDNPYKALEKLRRGVLQVTTMKNTSRDVFLHESGEEMIRRYDLVKNSETILGVPWPWTELNEETQGMLPEELIVIYGRLKSMKTFIGCIIAAHAYYWANRRVLFYSAEMGPEQLTMRMVAAICQVDYRLLKRGALDKKSEKSFKYMLNNVSKHEREDMVGNHRPSLLVTSDKDDERGIGGVGHIRSKADEFEPDLIVVDSYYRLRDDRTGRNDYDWKVQSGITQDLKHLAQNLQIPIIGITQANRSSPKMSMQEGMEDASFTDATGQEADLGIRVVKGSKSPFGVSISMICAAARELEMHGFKIKVKPFTRCDFEGFLEAPAEGEEEQQPTRTAVKKKEIQKEKPRDNRTAKSDEAAISQHGEEIRRKGEA